MLCAKALSKNPKIEWIKYSGLEGDSNYDNAQKYFTGGMNSGMVVFGIKGYREQVCDFMKALKLIKIVTHIADARTCVLHPATTTHRQLSNEELVACGISENLVRLSVGIENPYDLINDLEQALEVIK